MKRTAEEIKTLIYHLAALLLFWLITFFFQRLIFVAVNSLSAVDVPVGELVYSLFRGMMFDISIWGYVSLLTCAVVAFFAFFVRVRNIVKHTAYVTIVLSSLLVLLMPAEAITYKAWGQHVDAPSLMMLVDTPSLIFASTETWVEILYFLCTTLLVVLNCGLAFFLLRKAASLAAGKKIESVRSTADRISVIVSALIIGGLMIIPIRGGMGIAPLNTGKAYQSKYLFANHTALNPVWNFAYSIKRIKSAEATYPFMDDTVMEETFAKMTKQAGRPQQIFKTERPNVVIILLESFSAHGISYLGGVNATPNLDTLRHNGISFNNFFASSDRSGKGLVAVSCGYPALPNIRIIQYPQKTQNIAFLAKSLRANGYDDQVFVYGGDINFNNFNSLVNQAGYDRIVTQDDFCGDEIGDKWGAHDEYTFSRLMQIMDEQPEPFHDFYFTLSSHEPYGVPMRRRFDNDYLNSMCYTDSCLGVFMREAKKKKWWDNTVFVLVADHGHSGPRNVGITDRRRFNIPLIIVGGAVAVQDTIIGTYGSQTDIAATILDQLHIEKSEYTFSKNMLDSTAVEFAFFDFSDGFGYATKDNYCVYDNPMRCFLRLDNAKAGIDTINGQAYLQKIAKDFHQR